MQILPAIDLRGGKCVRLRQGDYAQETVFGDDPVAMARRWVGEGATGLHLVDLDGAREGTPINGACVRRIAECVGVPCQVGGGLRTEEDKPGPIPDILPAQHGDYQADRECWPEGDRPVVHVDLVDAGLARD